MHEAGTEAGGPENETLSTTFAELQRWSWDKFGVKINVCVCGHTGVDSKWYISQLKKKKKKQYQIIITHF